MSVIVPIVTVPGLNARENRFVRAGRVKAERKATATALATSSDAGAVADSAQCILLTRHAKKCDDDNLQGALKGVRDEVARWLGIDDGDARVQYCYAQTTCKRGEEHVSITFGHVTDLMMARALLLRWHGQVDASSAVWRDTHTFLAWGST